MKGARLTRSSRRRGSIERSGSRGDRWSVPRYRSARFDNAARTSLCLPIIGALNKGNRLRCRGHRRRTSLSTVRRALSSWTHRNWPRLIDARQFSSWPLHRRGSFPKGRGEGLAHGSTQGKRFVSASGRHVDPVNLHFLEMENGGCGKKKRDERPIDSWFPGETSTRGRNDRVLDPLGDRLNDEKGDSKVSLIIKLVRVWVYMRT